MEIPVTFLFYGPEKFIKLAKDEITKIEENLKETVKRKSKMYRCFLQGLLLGVLGSNVMRNIKMMFAIEWCPLHRGFFMKV